MQGIDYSFLILSSLGIEIVSIIRIIEYNMKKAQRGKLSFH
jgi:hypothetical protein